MNISTRTTSIMLVLLGMTLLNAGTFASAAQGNPGCRSFTEASGFVGFCDFDADVGALFSSSGFTQGNSGQAMYIVDASGGCTMNNRDCSSTEVSAISNLRLTHGSSILRFDDSSSAIAIISMGSCEINLGSCNNGDCLVNTDNCDNGACKINTADCSNGSCYVNVGQCNNARCTFNVGICQSGGACYINAGTCNTNATCLINSGTCELDGDCTINTGTCSNGDCTVNTGSCSTTVQRVHLEYFTRSSSPEVHARGYRDEVSITSFTWHAI